MNWQVFFNMLGGGLILCAVGLTATALALADSAGSRTAARMMLTCVALIPLVAACFGLGAGL